MAEGRKVALVTGCGKRDGIGAAIARRLTADGLELVVVDVEATGVRDSHEPALAARRAGRGGGGGGGWAGGAGGGRKGGGGGGRAPRAPTRGRKRPPPGSSAMP